MSSILVKLRQLYRDTTSAGRLNALGGATHLSVGTALDIAGTLVPRYSKAITSTTTTSVSYVSRATWTSAENVLYLETQCCNYWDSPCRKLEITKSFYEEGAKKLEMTNF